MKRVILNADEPNLLLALRAAKWLLEKPLEQKDAVLVYGERPNGVAIYVRRNKSSISAFQEKQQCEGKYHESSTNHLPSR